MPLRPQHTPAQMRKPLRVWQWYEGLDTLEGVVCVHRRLAGHAWHQTPWRVLLRWTWRHAAYRMAFTWVRGRQWEWSCVTWPASTKEA